MKKYYLSGYSLPELLLVLTILGILFSLTTINLLGVYHKNTLNTSTSTLTADMKQQQLKAMVGDTGGQPSLSSQGIYFESNRYTLYQGDSYVSSDPSSRFVINLSSDLQFSTILVPNSEIIFSKGSGEITNYNPSLDNVTLQNIRTGETKTIRINQFGTIIAIY